MSRSRILGTDQLAFGGLPSTHPHRDRLFVAIQPPPAIATRIEALTRRLRDDWALTGHPIAADRLHATLYSFDLRSGMPEALVDALRRNVDRLVAGSFEVAFKAVGSFLTKPIRRPLVLRGAPSDLSDLAAFRRQLVNNLIAAGLVEPYAAECFTPHVTLLYDDRNVALTQIEPIRWTVRDFVLVHSHVGRTRHDELGRWTLRG